MNNFLPIEQHFMVWAWLLAIEEQFYIVSPRTFILLMKAGRRWRVPLLVAVTLAAVGVFVRLLLTSPCPAPPPFQEIDSGRFLCYFDTLYDKFHTTAGALLMGVTTAYLYNYTQTVSWLDAHRGWQRLLLVMALLVLVPAAGFFETGGRGVFSTYCAFDYQYVFAPGIAYIILFMLTEVGRRSLVARVLESWIWYPFAQLSYSVYLVHPTVIIAVYLVVLTPTTRMSPVQALPGLALLCFAAAAVLYLAIERPARNARERYVKGANLSDATAPPRDPTARTVA